MKVSIWTCFLHAIKWSNWLIENDLKQHIDGHGDGRRAQ